MADDIVHVSCWSISILSGVVHHRRSSYSTEGAERAEATGPASDDEDVIVDFWDGISECE